MNMTKTNILYRQLHEKLNDFASRVAKRIDDIEVSGANIVYAGFLQDRITKANAAIILYRGIKTFDDDVYVCNL